MRPEARAAQMASHIVGKSWYPGEVSEKILIAMITVNINEAVFVAVNQEREACKKICRELSETDATSFTAIAKLCEERIRARGKSADIQRSVRPDPEDPAQKGDEQ